MKQIGRFLLSSLLALLLLLVNSPFAAAIYNANKESRFAYSGFIIIEEDDGKYGQCGINYVSPNLGITAAHCLENAVKVYAGVGDFGDDFKYKAIVSENFAISPDYNLTDYELYPGLGDVGVVVFDKAIPLNESANLASPDEGCGYFLVGYGQNESGIEMERRKVDVCLKNFTNHSLELQFSGNQHFCNGDSGSGIYKTGTSQLVGLVSSFYTEYGEISCENASAFIVTRLDDNVQFIKEYIQSTTDFETTKPETVLPDNYFGEYYPETKNPDGSGYNYNHDIEIEIERLSNIFDDIYPEEPGSQTQPTFVPTLSDNKGIEKIDPVQPAIEFIPPLVWCGICTIGVLFVVGVTIIIVIVLRKKKKPIQNTEAGL